MTSIRCSPSLPPHGHDLPFHTPVIPPLAQAFLLIEPRAPVLCPHRGCSVFLKTPNGIATVRSRCTVRAGVDLTHLSRETRLKWSTLLRLLGGQLLKQLPLVLQLLNIELHWLLRHNWMRRDWHILWGYLHQSWHWLERILGWSLELLRSPLLRYRRLQVLRLTFDHRYCIRPRPECLLDSPFSILISAQWTVI